MTKQSRVQKNYRKYLLNQKKDSAVNFLKFFMPEIIYRSTKLEGERITRKQVLSIF